MGVAYYIVLEGKIEGLDTMMDGKSLAHHIDSLDEAARSLGVPALSTFVSQNPEALTEFMVGEGMDTNGVDLPALQQFPAQDGLRTVRALHSHTTTYDEGVRNDLRDCERILKVAAERGVGWHFEIDI